MGMDCIDEFAGLAVELEYFLWCMLCPFVAIDIPGRVLTIRRWPQSCLNIRLVNRHHIHVIGVLRFS